MREIMHVCVEEGEKERPKLSSAWIPEETASQVAIPVREHHI